MAKSSAGRAVPLFMVYSVAPFAERLRPIVELKMIRVKRLDFAASRSASIEPAYAAVCATQSGGLAYK
jgi:hypothetical protein